MEQALPEGCWRLMRQQMPIFNTATIFFHHSTATVPPLFPSSLSFTEDQGGVRDVSRTLGMVFFCYYIYILNVFYKTSYVYDENRPEQHGVDARCIIQALSEFFFPFLFFYTN